MHAAIKHLLNFLFSLFAFSLFFILVLITLFQLPTIRKKSIDWLVERAQVSTGHQIQAHSVHGFLPFHWHIDQISIDDTLTLKELDFSLSLSHLFRGEIYLPHLSLDNVEHQNQVSLDKVEYQNQDPVLKNSDSFSLSTPQFEKIPIRIGHFLIKNVSTTFLTLPLNKSQLEGSFYLERGWDLARLSLHFGDPVHPLALFLSLHKESPDYLLHLHLKSDDQALSSYGVSLPLDFQARLSLTHEFHLKNDRDIPSRQNLGTFELNVSLDSLLKSLHQDLSPPNQFNFLLSEVQGLDIQSLQSDLYHYLKTISRQRKEHLPLLHSSAGVLKIEGRSFVDSDSLHLEKIHVHLLTKGEKIHHLKGKGSLLVDKNLQSIKGLLNFKDIQLDRISPLNGVASCQFDFSGSLSHPSIDLRVTSPQFQLGALKFFDLSLEGALHSSFENLILESKLFFTHDGHPFRGSLSAFYKENDYFHLKRLLIEEESLHVMAEMLLDTSQEKPLPKLGALDVTIDDFKKVPFSEILSLKGKLNLLLSYTTTPISKEELFKVNLHARDFEGKDLSVKKLDLTCLIQNPSSKPDGSLGLQMEQASFKEYALFHLQASSFFDQNHSAWPLNLDLKPFEKEDDFLHIDGKWNLHLGFLNLFLESFRGKYSHLSFSEKAPFKVQMAPDELSLEEMSLKFGEGSLLSSLKISQHQLSSHFDLDDISLRDLFHPFPFLPELEGHLSGAVALGGELQNPNGSFSLQMKKLTLKETTVPPLLINFEGALREGKLSFDGKAIGLKDHHLSLKGNIPIKLSLKPFKIEEPPHQEIDLQLLCQGEIAPLVESLFPDTTSVLGYAKGSFQVKGSLFSPTLLGKGELLDASFESLKAGLVFHHIKAVFSTDGKSILLNSLTGNEGTSGQIFGKGEVLVDFDKFPYHFDLGLKSASLLRLDLAQCSSSGSIQIKGNLDEGLVEGKLQLEECRVKIPEKLPSHLKTVDVTFIDDSKIVERSQKEPKRRPLNLNISFDAPKGIKIDGKDLSSKWKGNFTIEGNLDAPQVYGSLNLLQGSYQLNGKNLESRKGVITFHGDPGKTTLYVVGEEEIEQIKVQIIAKGQLMDPQIVFRSQPPMSQKEILSWILFNRGLSEITPFQGEELSQTVFTLSGGSNRPDILSKLRKNFGIDRIDFSSSEKDQLQEMSIRVGKYLSKKLFVSLNKGIGGAKNQIAVEANITKHIKVQAEIGDDSEGKMSLKWENIY